MQNLMRGEQPHIYHTDELGVFDEAHMPKHTGIKEIDKENRVARLNAMLDKVSLAGVDEMVAGVDEMVPIKSVNVTESELPRDDAHVFVLEHKTKGSNGAEAITRSYKFTGKPLPKHHLGHRGYTKPIHTRKKRVKPAKRK